MKPQIALLTLASLALASCGTLEISLDVTDTPPAVPTATVTDPPAPVIPPLPTRTPPAEAPTAAEPVPDLTLRMLANAAYHSVTLAEDEADFRLEDGVYYLPQQAQGWSGNWFVRLLMDRVAFGDLDGDGAQDAAAVFESQRGGSGLFRELAVMLNRGGQPENAATLYLGDRVTVRTIGIEDGVIFLDMLLHAPYDPMLSPSAETLFRYRWDGASLVPLD